MQRRGREDVAEVSPRSLEAAGTDVGDVVGDGTQRALISGDGAATNGEHVTHYSAPVLGTCATRPGLSVNLSGRTSGKVGWVR